MFAQHSCISVTVSNPHTAHLLTIHCCVCVHKSTPPPPTLTTKSLGSGLVVALLFQSLTHGDTADLQSTKRKACLCHGTHAEQINNGRLSGELRAPRANARHLTCSLPSGKSAQTPADADHGVHTRLHAAHIAQRTHTHTHALSNCLS